MVTETWSRRVSWAVIQPNGFIFAQSHAKPFCKRFVCRSMCLPFLRVQMFHNTPLLQIVTQGDLALMYSAVLLFSPSTQTTLVSWRELCLSARSITISAKMSVFKTMLWGNGAIWSVAGIMLTDTVRAYRLTSNGVDFHVSDCFCLQTSCWKTSGAYYGTIEALTGWFWRCYSISHICVCEVSKLKLGACTSKFSNHRPTN